jgi:hypothetical protein
MARKELTNEEMTKVCDLTLKNGDYGEWYSGYHPDSGRYVNLQENRFRDKPNSPPLQLVVKEKGDKLGAYYHPIYENTRKDGTTYLQGTKGKITIRVLDIPTEYPIGRRKADRLRAPGQRRRHPFLD